MFRGIGFGAHHIGFFALKSPKIALSVMLALLILIGLSLPRVAFDDDINRVFLSDSQLSQAQLSYEASLRPRTSALLILVHSEAAFTTQQMAVIRDMTEALGDINGVEFVASPFSLRWPLNSLLWPFGDPVFEETISDDFLSKIDAFNDFDTGLPTLISPNGDSMIINVTVNTEKTPVKVAIDSVSTELAAMLPDSLKANITGEEAISAEVVSGLKDDLLSLNMWGALLIALAAFLLLRDFRMTALAVIPALFGAASVLALSVWLGYPVTVLSNVIPILILVLGVANGLHLVGHLKNNGSLHDAVKTVAPACALTALTTAIAFACIMLSGNEQMYEFAVLGAVGTLQAYVVVIVSFALLGRVIKLSERPVPPLSLDIARNIANTGSRWPRTTIALCLTLLVVSFVGFTQTKAWFPLYQNLPDNSETRAVNDAISKDFGGVFRMIVQTNGSWDQTKKLVEALEAETGPRTVLSEVNIARWWAHPSEEPSQKELDRFPPQVVEAFSGADNVSRIFVSVPEPMRSDQTLDHFDVLYNTAQDNGADQILGLPTIMRVEAVRLIDQLSSGLILAALGGVTICALAFRSIRLLPVLAVPNVLPLVLTGASLHFWAEGELTPTAVLALTIAFGIAIDDTVHFLSRYNDARAIGETVEQAVITATRAAGQVMVLTTLLLTIGLSVTLLSDFTPIRLFGGLMIVTLWTALLIDLLLLPALLSWKRTRGLLR